MELKSDIPGKLPGETKAGFSTLIHEESMKELAQYIPAY
jgi:hypothetical protein